MYQNSKFLAIFVLISAIVLVEFLQCANANAKKEGKTKPNHHAAVPPGSPTHGKAKTQQEHANKPANHNASGKKKTQPKNAVASPAGAGKKKTQPKNAVASPAGAGKKKTQKPTAVKPPSSPTHKTGQKHDQKEMEFLKKALNEVIAKHYEQKHSAKDQHHKEHAGKEDLKTFEKVIIDQFHKKCNEEGNKKGANNKKNYAKAAKLTKEELKKLLETDIQTAFKKNEIFEKEVEKAVKEAIKSVKKNVEAGKIQGNIQSTAMNNVIKEMKKHEHDVGKLDKNDKAHVKKLIETEIGKDAHKKEIEKLKKDAEEKHAAKPVHPDVAKEKAQGKKKGGKHEVPSNHLGGSGHGHDSLHDNHHGHGSAPPSPTGKSHKGGDNMPSSHTDKSHKNPKFGHSGFDHAMIPEPHFPHQKSENSGNHNIPEQHNEEEYAHFMDRQNDQQNESSDSYYQFDGMDEEQRNESDDDSLPLTRGNRYGASFGGVEDDVEQRGEESARPSAEVHEQEDEGPVDEAGIQRLDNSVDPDDQFGDKPQKAEDEEDGKELRGGLDHPEEEETIPSETNSGVDLREEGKSVDVNEDDETKQNVEVTNEKEKDTESVDEVAGGIKNPAEGNVNKDGDDI